MPSFEEHCRECERELGAPFAEVHLWLDAYAGTPGYGMRHRRVRHHEAGIMEATKLFGTDAGKAARLHILADLKSEGWTDSDPFPQIEQHYVRMGLY